MSLGAPVGFHATKEVCFCGVFLCIHVIFSAFVYLLYSASMWLLCRAFFCGRKQLGCPRRPHLSVMLGVWCFDSTGCVGRPWTVPALLNNWLTDCIRICRKSLPCDLLWPSAFSFAFIIPKYSQIQRLFKKTLCICTLIKWSHLEREQHSVFGLHYYP